jgi:LAO/AO transport system ATPase/phenylacetic acid degradation protein PaaD
VSQRHPPAHDWKITPGLLTGDRRVVARTISQIEQGEINAEALSAALRPHLGRSHVLGITGAPGAGKSTLIHALLGEMLARGLRVGVVAVDPSSPISGGAVLGDRVRMGQHGAHPDVFIRSLAARGHLGGLSHSTEQIVDVLDAAGFDTIIVETVGAGQSEVEIMRVADTRVVACPPGLGDNVQAIKAGILEIADLLVVTKSDLAGADATMRDLKDMLHLRASSANPWTVPVLGCCASKNEGVADLLDRIQEHASMAGRGQRLQGRTAPRAQGEPLRGKSLVLRLAAADPFACSLGITCTEADEGSATVSLTLDQRHLNFNGTCHGGVVFALADTAFGLASNSHGKVAAGIDAHVTYQQAARAGDMLTARAVEISRSRKLAVYRVDVNRVDGAIISSFTGTVYITGVDVAVPGKAASQETM